MNSQITPLPLPGLATILGSDLVSLVLIVLSVLVVPVCIGTAYAQATKPESKSLSPGAKSAKELAGPPAAPQLGQDALARELSNPVSTLGSLSNKFEYREFTGDLPNADDQESFTYTFQPVLPFPLANGDRLIFRPAFPVLLDQPVFDAAAGDFDRKTAFGDIAFDLLYGHSYKSGLVIGGGVFGILPTNTDDDLSKNQWQFGPDVILAYIQKWGVIGAIITHVWDVAGDDDTDTNLTSINYLYAFGIGNGWQISSGPTISIDWDANRDDRLTLPIGFGVSKTTRTGNTPLKLALDINKTLVGPDTFGQDWLIKLTVTPVIKLPWGKK